MSGKEVKIATEDGSFISYMSIPPSGTATGVVVIQKIFGVNRWTRSMAGWFAARGYVALAPDIFWRMKPAIQLDPTIDAELEEGSGYYKKFAVDRGAEDIQATIVALRRIPERSGGVGAVGSCLGGLLAYLTSTRTDALALFKGALA